MTAWCLLTPGRFCTRKSLFSAQPINAPREVLAASLTARQSVFLRSPCSSGSSVPLRSSRGISRCFGKSWRAATRSDLFSAMEVANAAPSKPSPLCGTSHAITSSESRSSLRSKMVCRDVMGVGWSGNRSPM